MEVTKHNFDFVLPKFVSLLESCDFYCLDLEMTGINPPANEELPPKAAVPCSLTAPVENHIFPNKDAAAQRYSIIQIGVALFHRNPRSETAGRTSLPSSQESPLSQVFEEDDQDDHEQSQQPPRRRTSTTADRAGGPPTAYTMRAFNFYIFPSPRTQKDVRMHPETVGKFLTSHGMDFSKWIREGIPYMAKEDANELDAHTLGPSTREELEEFAKTEPVFRKFFEQLKSLAHDGIGESVEVPFLPSSAMGAANAAYQLLGLKRVSYEANGKRKTKIVRDDQALLADDEAFASRREKEIGALRLWEVISTCGKPLIIHNGMSDLLFLYHAFNRAPLRDYQGFKTAMRRFFPLVYDTRTLVTLPAMKYTPDMVQNLGGQFKHMYAKHKAALRIRFELGMDHFHPLAVESLGRGAHEAAYDAYMTGVLFLCMERELGAETVRQHVNQLAVYGSVVTCRLNNATDIILNTGPILHIKNESQAGSISGNRVDGALQGTGFQGRVMIVSDGAVVFSSQLSGASRPDEPTFRAHFTKAKANLTKMYEGAQVSIIFDPAAESPEVSNLPKSH